MSSWGKIAGCGVGLFFGGPFGAAFGLAVGHAVDSGIVSRFSGPNARRLDQAFGRALFAGAAVVAKADGRVSEAEIGVVESIMNRLRISGPDRSRFIRFFDAAKSPDYPIEQDFENVLRYSNGIDEIRLLLADLLTEVALADGWLKEESAGKLRELCAILRIECPIAGASEAPARQSDPHRVLGIAAGASFKEVQTAYRRLLSRYHPDKLGADGDNSQAVQLAEHRTIEIRRAFEQLKKEYGA